VASGGRAGSRKGMRTVGVERAVRQAAVALVAAGLVMSVTGLPGAKEAKRPPEGPLVTIHAPQPQRLELALDEVELDWSRDPSTRAGAPGTSPVAIAGTTIVERDGRRAVVAVPRQAGALDLLQVARALEAANPDAEAHLVLYEPGLPRGTATRRLLTREVSLLLDPGKDPAPVLAGFPVGGVRAVRGVPGAYVVDAGDPLAALDLADALRGRPGVRAAAPLLKRLRFPR